MDPIIDVVIPTFRPDERLLYILESMAAQTPRPRCVRIINTEKDGLDALLRNRGSSEEMLIGQYPFVRITHIRREEFDHGGTRNRGFRMCGGAEYVLTMTQDAVPADEELIGRLLAALQMDPRTVSSRDAGEPSWKTSGEDGAENAAAPEGTIAVAYARQLPNADALAEERLSREFNYPAQSRIKSEADRGELGIKTYFCSNVCAIYRMDIWRELNGFPERAIFNEDMIYACKALRAGYRTYYAAQAQVYHSHNYTASQQFHRNFDLGVSQAQNPQVFGGLTSEGEGVSYVKAVIGRMMAEHEALRVPGFVWRCAARLAGYRLGKAYERLPKSWAAAFSSNKGYWNV